MRTFRILSAVVALTLVLGGVARAQEGDLPGERGWATPEEAAGQALPLIAALNDAEMVRTLGFEGLDERSGAQLAQRIPVFELDVNQLRGLDGVENPVYEVSADEIRAMDAGQRELLSKRPTQMIYPITVDGEVRSSVTVQQFDDPQGGVVWKMTTIGTSHLTQRLVELQSGLEGPFFALNVSSIYQMFLGYGIGPGILFVPVYEDSRLGSLPGPGLPAAAVFKVLIPLARNFRPPLGPKPG